MAPSAAAPRASSTAWRGAAVRSVWRSMRLRNTASTASIRSSVTLLEYGLTISVARCTLPSMPRTRVLLLLALGAVAIAVIVGAVLRLGGGDSPSDPVARVGGAAITRGQLDETVAHFRQEADKEGKPFPDEGSSDHRTVERELVGLLVYRAELEQTAARLGVPVTAAEVQKRLTASTEEIENGAAERRFAEATVKAQVAYEHIYRKVTSGSPTTRRGQAANQYIAKMKRDYADDVTYEDGYAPET